MKNLRDSFLYMMPEEIETIAEQYKLKILHHITSDGNPLMWGQILTRPEEKILKNIWSYI